MCAKYVLRLDDASPTMDREKWGKIEGLCNKYSLKPIVAVIPDNKDPSQIRNKEDKDFWNKVRSWQTKGWHIALHGYNHIYVSSCSGLLPFNKRSEFAGLTYRIQAEKIKGAIDIFRREGIRTKIWVAPAHSFDENTLKALKEHTEINIISDGIALFPFEKYGFKWIPLQLWHFRKMSFGVWTCCVHPNEMTFKEYMRLEEFIKLNHKYFISDFDEMTYSTSLLINLINNTFSFVYWKFWKLKKLYKKIVVFKKVFFKVQ